MNSSKRRNNCHLCGNNAGLICAIDDNPIDPYNLSPCPAFFPNQTNFHREYTPIDDEESE